MERYDTVKRRIGREELNSFLYRRYVEEGKTLREIGKELGVSAERVRQLMEWCGIRRRRVGSRRIIIDVKKAKKLYEKGWPLGEIGKLFGVTGPTVRRCLVEVGVKTRGRSWRRKSEEGRLFGGEVGKKLLWKMYVEGGMSVRRIADMCGVSPMTVWRAMKRHGIPLKKRGRR